MSRPALALPVRSAYAPGAFPMATAPSVTLPDGSEAIPQHYLRYQQTAQSLEALLHDIEFDAHTLLFSGEDVNGLYVQVGLIGRENYNRDNQLRQHKLVYGRKWRIDVDTPNSEIIQTAFLAIQKAREHEVRELLTLRPQERGSVSAALSNHQDLAILRSQAAFLTAPSDETWANPNSLEPREYITLCLARMQFGQRALHLRHIEQRHTGQWLVEFQLGAAPLARMQEADLPEFEELTISILLRQLDRKELVYAVMDSFIQHSNRHVEEQFRVAQFVRFSRQIDPFQIARLSLATRPYARDANDAQFTKIFQESNYSVDAGRAARLGQGTLGQKNRTRLRQFVQEEGFLGGHLPADLF